MLAQYLLGFMGGPGHGVDPLSELLGGMFPPGRGMPHGGDPEDGRWGDYVFNQQGKVLSLMVRTITRSPIFLLGSPRPDHIPDHGEQQCTPTCSGDRRGHCKVVSGRSRNRMYAVPMTRLAAADASAPAPLLEKDCAVCKDQFKLETEDPDE